MNYAELLHRPLYAPILTKESLTCPPVSWAEGTYHTVCDHHFICSTQKDKRPLNVVHLRGMKLDRVTITGACGTIGSAIVRKLTGIAGCIFACDRDERALAAMEQTQDVRPVLLDVTERTDVFEAFRCQRPDLVIHCAAYKHVPLMEYYPFQAVRNNIIGTKNVVDAFAKPRTDARFVFVSTDKAASRKTVMGCTKWLAEEYVASLAVTHNRTLTIVRFGNVLGSSGSVIEIWERQLAAGEPLTVVEGACRYFCTIDEAAAVAIAGSTMFIDDDRASIKMTLPMGDPIPLTELAARFLAFKGVPDHPVEVTGLRNGDQEHETLVGAGEEICAANEAGELEVVHV